nr:hypothetical protein [Tanacetum cinerariifolium]
MPTRRSTRTQEAPSKPGSVLISTFLHEKNTDGVQPKVFENPIAFGEPRISKSPKQNVSKDFDGKTQAVSLNNPTSHGESLTVNLSRKSVIKIKDGKGLTGGDGISVSRMAGSFVRKESNPVVNHIAATFEAVASENNYTSLGDSTLRSMMNPSSSSKLDVEDEIWSSKEPTILVSDISAQPGISTNLSSIGFDGNDFGYIQPTGWNLNNVPTKNDRVNFRPMVSENVFDEVNISIPHKVVVKVSARIENTLYGYFIGKTMAFPVVEYYAKNNWAKHGLKRIMMNANEAEFKESITIGIPELDGPDFIKETIQLDYEWKPSRCNIYNIFGHTGESCRKRVVNTLVVNNTNNSNTSNDGFQQVMNENRNNKKNVVGNSTPRGVPVAKGFQVGKQFNYQPKAPNSDSNRGPTSFKIGTCANEGASTKKVNSIKTHKGKDVVVSLENSNKNVIGLRMSTSYQLIFVL